MVKDCPLYTTTRGICPFQHGTIGNLTYVRAGWEPLHSGPYFPRPGLQDREADRHQDWPRYTRHQVGRNGAPHSLFIIVPCGESHAAQAVLWSCVLGIYVI